MLTKSQNQIAHLDDLQSTLWASCGEFEILPAKRREMVAGGVTLVEKSGIEMAIVGMDTDRIVRDRSALKRDDGENYFLVLQEQGSALMMQGDMAACLTPGDMVLVDSASPSEFVFSGKYSQQLSVHLPRQEMHQRFGDMIKGGFCVQRHEPMSIAIHAVLAKVLSDSPIQRPEAADYLSDAFFSLLGAVLSQRAGREDSGSVNSASGNPLFTEILAYLDSRFQDPELTIAGIADDLGVNLRQLQRTLKISGETASSHILNRRLTYARNQLGAMSRGLRHDLISTIAYEAGFNDLSYFNQVFRNKYGVTPSEFASEFGSENI